MRSSWGDGTDDGAMSAQLQLLAYEFPVPNALRISQYA